MSLALAGITIDARDAAAVATFWAGALGRSVADGATAEAAALEADPAVPGSRIGFRQVPEDKKVKNRLHFDFVTGDLDGEVARLTGLGATTLSENNPGFRYNTMADPEGNEFDVIAH